MVGVLVAFVVWSELRAAGCSVEPARLGAREPDGRVAPALTLADVANAPLAERPGMLLRLLGEALTRAQRLPAAEASPPPRSHAARASIGGRTRGARLVAATAETVRYAEARLPMKHPRRRGHGETAARRMARRRAGADA